MSAESVIATTLCVLLLAYLVYTLIRPDRF